MAVVTVRCFCRPPKMSCNNTGSCRNAKGEGARNLPQAILGRNDLITIEKTVDF